MAAQINNKAQRNRNIISWAILIVISGLYTYFTFQSPSQQAMSRYNLDGFQLNLLRLSIVVPVLFIWSAILYSSLKLYDYSQTIINNEDGKAFRLITKGIFSMLVSSVVSSFISLIIQFSQNDQALIKNLRIFNNYLTVVFALLSFYLIWKGSQKLISMVNAEKKVRKHRNVILFSIFLLAFPYVYFVLQNPVRSVSSIQGINSTYNLPDVLIFATIVVPYILTWFLGIFAVVNMSIFKQETKGVIYKSVLDKFYKGFLTVIIFAISLQYLRQFSVLLSHAALSIILIIIYVILFVNAIGLVLIAEGAKKLTKIETAV